MDLSRWCSTRHTPPYAHNTGEEKDDEHRRSLSHRCARCAMGGSPACAAPAHVASWGTRAETPGPPPRHQWHFLCQQDGVPMAHAAHRVWTMGDGLRLLAPLAARRGLDAGHGHAAPVGTPEPRAAARTVRLLCG